MKKIIALAMAGVLALTAFAGCSISVSESSSKAESKTESKATEDSAPAGADWDYLADKGTFTIGITYYEPMNYKDANGKLVGFETEFSEAVCAELGLTPKFQEIEWDSKELELNSKSIDCIWNGMTITPERQQNMDISMPYLDNKQIMVCKKENAEKFADDVSGATVVAEAGSAGETIAREDDFFADANFESLESQATALLEVKAGTADIAIIDYVMAVATIKEGSDFESLTAVEGITFGDEQFGVALRKNSPATLEKLNAAIQKVADNGKLKEIADKYNLGEMIAVKPAA